MSYVPTVTQNPVCLLVNLERQIKIYYERKRHTCDFWSLQRSKKEKQKKTSNHISSTHKSLLVGYREHSQGGHRSETTKVAFRRRYFLKDILTGRFPWESLAKVTESRLHELPVSRIAEVERERGGNPG
jgi:hypothetical protein